MKKYLVAAGLICLPVALAAWQGGMTAMGITSSGLESQIERATRQKGDGLTLSILSPAQLVAAKALPEPQQAALMKELASAAKAILMSPAFQSAHDAYIAKEYQAVNHGLKVKSLEQVAQGATSKAGASEFELKMKREMAAIYVQMAMQTKIEDLSVSNPDKFRRGYAVLRSAENDGLDTEEALFGAQASSQNDNEQLMWDKHNLRGALKRLLTQAVAEAPTVDFAAQTVQKSGSRVFVNPAYEKKSLTWKAMYRAGKVPTAAGLEIARAWLKEL